MISGDGIMKEVIEFLKKNDTEYQIGIINNGYFRKLPKPFEDKQVISFQWKKNSIDKLISNLTKSGVELIEKSSSKYNALYDIKGTENQILVRYAVDSHVQLPKLLLKNYRTGDDLFYISTKSNELIKTSASTYNTSFGYYSLWFEEHLSNKYESIISKIIRSFKPFLTKEVTSFTLENLYEDINKLFLMSYIRSPEFVGEVNKNSLTSILFDGGYDAEFLMITGEDMNDDYIKGYVPVPVVNESSKNFVTLKSLVSNLYIDGGINCMVMLLHPKIAIALVPIDYYEKMIEEQGNGTYLKVSEENVVMKMNKQVYSCAKFRNDDVIGIKDDLEDLLKNIADWK